MTRVKSRLSSLDVAVLANELNNVLRESRVDNIYSIEGRPNAILLKLRLTSGESTFLYLEGGVRANLTRYVGRRSSSHSASLFRRFLRESRIVGIRQHEFERIIIMDVIMPRGAEGRIIAELIPRGLITLLDYGGKVLVASSSITTKDRAVRAGWPYKLPPQLPNPFKTGVNDWVRLLKGRGGKLGSALVRVLGIPPEVVNEVLDEGLRSARVADLEARLIEGIRDSLLNFMKEVINRPEPVIVECFGTPTAFYPFRPKSIPSNCMEVSFPSFNDAVDEYFMYLESLRESERIKESASPKALQLKRALSKAIDSAESLKQRVNELETIIKAFEKNYPILERVWTCVRDVVKSEGWDAVRKLCKVSDADPKNGTFSVDLKGIKVVLSLREDFSRQYFNLRKELGKAKKKLGRAEEAIKDLRRKLESESLRVEAEKLRRPVFLKYEWFMQYRWIVTSEGYLAIGGRDAQQNEKVVRKYLNDNDVFLHADVHGAPAFIIKCNGNVPGSKSLFEVATLAVSYSRGWKEGVGALDAFWVWGSQVSKSPPPGEYLPRGSFMIYGRRNYIRGVKLEISIGVEVLGDKYYRLIAGPEDLVRSRCVCYVTLAPGDRGVGSLAKELVKFMKECSNYSFVGLDTSQVQQLIPGPSRVLKRHGFGGRRITLS